MKPKLPPNLIQIAGAHDIEEANLIARAGATLLGIPLRLPVNQPDQSEEDARELVRNSPIPCVLITYLSTANELEELAQFLGVQFIQIHGDIRPEELHQLRLRQPDWVLFKSIVIRPDSRIEELVSSAQSISESVDAFITDTYNPETGATGATGLTHDWTLSAELCRQLERPLILAGGLHPDNVADSIRAVRPFGVDAHTGVEATDGRKTYQQVRDFCRSAESAFGNPA